MNRKRVDEKGPTSHVVFIPHLVLSIYPDGCHLAKRRTLHCFVLCNCANRAGLQKKIGQPGQNPDTLAVGMGNHREKFQPDWTLSVVLKDALHSI